MPPEVLKGHGSNETSIKRAEGESSLIISSVSSLRVYLNSIPAGRCPILSNAGISFPPSFTFVRFFARRSTTGFEQRNRSDSRRHPACRPLTEEKFSQLSSTNKVVCQRPSSTRTSPIDTFTLPLSHSPLSLPSRDEGSHPPRRSFLDEQAKGFTRLSTRLTNRHWPAFPSRHFLPRIRPTWHGWSPTLFVRLRGTRPRRG